MLTWSGSWIWSTPPTAGPRRPSPSYATWPAASTRPSWTTASAPRSPPSPHTATCPSSSSWTCPGARRPRSRPSPTSARRNCSPMSPSTAAPGMPRWRQCTCPACCGCGSATTAPAAPASRPAAAWPGSPSGSGPWMAGCGSAARPEVPPWSPSSCRPTPDRTGAPMRIVIAEDSAVVRAGLAEILADRGHQVVAAVGTAEDLLAAVDEHQPDVIVVDVRMPPGYTDEGLRAAIAIRRDHPKVGVLVFSQYIETRYTADLLGAASGASAAGVGYLLKDRVADVGEFVEALSRVAAGGTALDPEVVTQLLGASRRTDGLGTLTARERDVLALMAEGRSNGAIARALVISERAVEKHVANIFSKLGLAPSDADHRRVLAVLRYLES